MASDFNYIIIGSGPAGRTAAFKLAKAKKRVAIIDGQTPAGTDCQRDIPYLLSLNFAHDYYRMKNCPAFSGQDLHYNFPTLVSHQEKIISAIDEENNTKLDKAGVVRIKGNANFIDNKTVAVGNQQYTANNFIIATGSRLKTTGISGLESVNHLTPNTALKVRRLPRYVFVVGGGPTGCEIAEYYAELGTKVIIMERGSQLLPREDKEVGACIEDYFTNELGIMVITSAKVVALEQDNISKRVIFTTGGQEKFVRVDCIVLATGSEPSLDLGLENVNVEYKNTGIVVNKYFQTTNKNIFAIGDAIDSQNSSTERSKYEASILASNLLHRTKIVANYTGFIRSVDTFPAVATVGLNDHDLLERDRKSRRSIVQLKDYIASKIAEQEHGFIKLVADSSDHIVGATIVTPNATLIAEELATAIRHRISATNLVDTPYSALGYNQAIKTAARKFIR